MSVPGWLWRLPINIINRESTDCGLSRNLVASIVMAETSGNDYASRYEPLWKYFYRVDYHAKRNRISIDTERVSQATSWGHMQIMGGVARELGYEGPLVRLSQPLMGIKWGCIKLKDVCNKYSNLEDAISSYNQGSPRKVGGQYANQSYVDKVNKFLNELE